MIVQKYQDSTTEEFFENARRYQSLLGVGAKKKQKKIRSKYGGFTKCVFHVFDRYEINTQACVLFSNGKCIIFQSLSPRKNIVGENPNIIFEKKSGCTFQNFRKLYF